MPGVNDALKHIAEIAKRTDQGVGWTFQERKLLRVNQGVLAREYEAEIQRETPFGFSMKPVERFVRVQVGVTELPAGYAEHGISLYEGEQLFGKEKAWRVEGMDELSGGIVDLILREV
jgi:hypothetical protein